MAEEMRNKTNEINILICRVYLFAALLENWLNSNKQIKRDFIMLSGWVIQQLSNVFDYFHFFYGIRYEKCDDIIPFTLLLEPHHYANTVFGVWVFVYILMFIYQRILIFDTAGIWKTVKIWIFDSILGFYLRYFFHISIENMKGILVELKLLCIWEWCQGISYQSYLGTVLFFFEIKRETNICKTSDCFVNNEQLGTIDSCQTDGIKHMLTLMEWTFIGWIYL